MIAGQQDSTTPVSSQANIPAAITTPGTTIAPYTQPLSHSLTLFSATSTQVIVSEKYRRDYEAIQDRFAQLFDEVGELLENEESVTLERLKKYLSKIPEMRHLLDNAYTISDIIDIIQEHSSFTCCSHLKGVARRFNVPVAIEKIEKYHQFIKELGKSILNGFIIPPVLFRYYDLS